MNRATCTFLTAIALAVGVSSIASADPPGAPGCFGQFTSGFAQTGTLGGLVSGVAPNSVPYGQTTVPAFKRVACGT